MPILGDFIPFAVTYTIFSVEIHVRNESRLCLHAVRIFKAQEHYRKENDKKHTYDL
jgi:hypothetical protein